MSEVKMTPAEVLAVLDEWIQTNNQNRPRKEPKVRMDRELEEAREAVAALVAERDSLQVGHDALLTVRETLKRECEALKTENERLREAIASASDTFLEALAGAGHDH